MVKLDAAGVRYARTWLGPPKGPGLLALRHAVEVGSAGLRGDHRGTPQSILLTREGDDGRLDAFGAGVPGPGVEWLVASGRAVMLHAPTAWAGALGARVGRVETVRVETWSGAKAKALVKGPAQVRRLNADDGPAFLDAAPAWALRGWGAFPALNRHGAAFGVPTADGMGFVALAWVFDQAGAFDAVGVFTTPRFRRLGLGRAAASALVEFVLNVRGRIPLWSTDPANEPSRAFAEALGFRHAADEPLIAWPPRI